MSHACDRGGRRRLADHPGPPRDRQRHRPGAGRRAGCRPSPPGRRRPGRCCCWATARGSASAATCGLRPRRATRAPSSAGSPHAGTRSSGAARLPGPRGRRRARRRRRGRGRPGRRLRPGRLPPGRRSSARPTAAIGLSPDGGTLVGAGPRAGRPARAGRCMLTNGTLTAADAHRVRAGRPAGRGRGAPRRRDRAGPPGRRRPGPGDGPHPGLVRRAATRPWTPSSTRRPG